MCPLAKGKELWPVILDWSLFAKDRGLQAPTRKSLLAAAYRRKNPLAEGEGAQRAGMCEAFSCPG